MPAVTVKRISYVNGKAVFGEIFSPDGEHVEVGDNPLDMPSIAHEELGKAHKKRVQRIFKLVRDGLTFGEIAEKEGCHISTISNRLDRMQKDKSVTEEDLAAIANTRTFTATRLRKRFGMKEPPVAVVEQLFSLPEQK